MRIKNHVIACTFAICALPVTAWAFQPSSAPQGNGALGHDLSYNYVQGALGFGGTDPDGPGGGDGLALNVGGSANVLPHVNILGFYNHTFGSDFDTDMLSVGPGYHLNLQIDSPVRLDAFGNVSLEYININNDYGSHDDVGVGLRAGLRAKFAPRLQANGSVGYVTYGSEDGPVIQLGGGYAVNDRLGLRATFRHYSMDHFSIDQFLVGARYYFNEF